MLTPMQIRMAAAGGGEDIVLLLDPNGGESNYTPGQIAPYEPAARTPDARKAIFEKAPETGPVTRTEGKVMFYSPTLIPLLLSRSARVRIVRLDIDFLAVNVRTRFYCGVMDGYSMDLEK